MTRPPTEGTTRRTILAALREAMGMPGLVLAGSYVGFGSLVRESGFTLAEGLVSTATGWALPAQVALVELYAVGASLVAIALAVALTNMRLMPMCITIMPLIRRPGAPRWWYYALAHVTAVTTWAVAMRRLPEVEEDQRVIWYASFGAALWAVTLLGTAVGFFLAGMVPAPVGLGLVFLNPVYFMLLFAMDLRQRMRALALGFGAVLGPLLHLAVPDYGLLVTGIVGGTLAFWIDDALARRERRNV